MLMWTALTGATLRVVWTLKSTSTFYTGKHYSWCVCFHTAGLSLNYGNNSLPANCFMFFKLDRIMLFTSNCIFSVSLSITVSTGNMCQTCRRLSAVSRVKTAGGNHILDLSEAEPFTTSCWNKVSNYKNTSQCSRIEKPSRLSENCLQFQPLFAVMFPN